MICSPVTASYAGGAGARPHHPITGHAASRYSMTSSARAINACGTISPSVVAVLRLISNSTFVDCLHQQVRGLLSFENAARIDADQAKHVGEARPICHKPAGHYSLAVPIHRRQPMACRQRDKLIGVAEIQGLSGRYSGVRRTAAPSPRGALTASSVQC